MNYPIWYVPFGAGLLIAVVSILHVFVSHFAVGTGLFLVLTERRAYRKSDDGLLGWLQTHSKFFVLVSVVFGVISGVGIWFTIGLVHPSATSTLIHTFVWAWAIEWVFFFLEITAALLYLYGWSSLDRKTHLRLGWIYFAAAFMSMVVINGMITFMLTPGAWVQNREFWSGFLNPTYIPSLFLRFTFALALSGIYALITASVLHDAELKRGLVMWSARWILPAFLLLPVFAYWYVQKVPPDLWQATRGPIQVASRYASAIAWLAGITVVLSLSTLVRPRRLNLAHAVLVVAAAFSTMWAFEFVRESIRKPYVIAGYMYGNSLLARPATGDGGFTTETLRRRGVMAVANWIEVREVSDTNHRSAGGAIFRTLCTSCHTVGGYRGVRQYIERRAWDEQTMYEMLSGLELMRGGVMPPFAGTDRERQALAAYLSFFGPGHAVTEGPSDGERVFIRFCEACHSMSPQEPAIALFRDTELELVAAALENLPGLYPAMPAIELTQPQRFALAEYLRRLADKTE